MIRDEVRRLVVLVRQLGEEPVQLDRGGYREYAAALNEQYTRLRSLHSREVMNQVRSQARNKIQTMGLANAAAPMPKIRPTPKVNPKYVWKRVARLKRRCDSYPGSSHVCPQCRMSCGIPKMSWHSRALAEDSRARTGVGPGMMMVYECPHEPGNWHLGHSKRGRKLLAAQKKAVPPMPEQPL